MHLDAACSAVSGAPPYVAGAGAASFSGERGGGCSTDVLLDLECRTDGLVCAPAIYETAGLASCGIRHSRNRLIITPPDPLPARIAARAHIVSYKIVIKSADGETVWVRPFYHFEDATAVWLRLIGSDHLVPFDGGFSFPSAVIDGALVYEFATVETFNATPGGGTWTVPAGVTAVDYLVVAGGGGGGGYVGGGGGAGGMRSATGFAVTPGATPTLTVGAGGAGGSGAATGTAGSNSVFSTITSTGGGYGGYDGVIGGAGGSGGGSSNSAFAGGAGTGGQGNNGGAGANPGGAAGGGGAGAVGANANGTTTAIGGAGGAGLSSSISGSSVDYAGGGGGGGRQDGGGSIAGGAGGLGGGGAGGNSPGGNGTAGTANTGGGGGGGCYDGSTAHTGGAGGSGRVVLSYTPRLARIIRRRPVRSFQRSF